MEALNRESLAPFVVVGRISFKRLKKPVAKRAVLKVSTYYFYFLFFLFSKFFSLGMEAENKA